MPVISLAPAPATSTVFVLSETGGDALCIAFRGLVRRADHKRYLRDNLVALVKAHGGYSLLIDYTAFAGWEPDAAAISLESIVEFGPYARKLAYINPPEKKIMQHKLSGSLFGGETRFFDDLTRAEAFAWVKS